MVKTERQTGVFITVQLHTDQGSGLCTDLLLLEHRHQTVLIVWILNPDP